MKIKFVDPELLKSAAYNPRQISREELNKLIKSIKQFGFVDPALVRKQDNMIVGGHQRIKAAQELGLKEIPVVYLDITENAAKLLNVALNKISGDWDEDKLTELLAELKFFDDVDELLTGFDEDELDQLIADLEEPKEGLTDDDAIPEEVEAICKEGQLWQLGSHRLLCGDATNIKDLEILTDGFRADMVFTDPPYGIDYSGGRTQVVATKQYGKLKNDNLGQKETGELISHLFNFVKAEGDVYICVSPINQKPFLDILHNKSKKLDGVIVWDKQNAGLGYMAYRRQCEFIYFIKGKPFKKGDKSDFDLWKIARDNSTDYKHGTQKPVELVARAIINSSKKEDLILDYFLGSGSTLIACEKTNRKCYGMELDPHYCDVIIKRWEDYTGQKAELLNGSL